MTAAPMVRGGTTARTGTVAALALVAVTAIWGSTFPMAKDLLTRLPVLDYLALRYLLAGVVLALSRPARLTRLSRQVVGQGVVLGGVYCLAQAVQFQGLRSTDATVAAFLVSMYVVFTPLLTTLISRRLPSAGAAAITALAATGVGVMTLRGWQLGPGEVLTLLAAGMYAGHILLLGRARLPGSSHALTVVQLLTMAACFLILALPGGLTVPQRSDWPAFLYLALVAGAVPLLVQTWAQAHLDTTQAAVLMVLEPVWAAFFGTLLWHQTLDWRIVVGGSLVLLAMLLIITRPSPGAVVPRSARLAE